MPNSAEIQEMPVSITEDIYLNCIEKVICSISILLSMFCSENAGGVSFPLLLRNPLFYLHRKLQCTIAGWV